MQPLKSVRLANYITQEQLATMSGVSRKTLGNIENGKNKNPTTITVERIARALNVAVSDIFLSLPCSMIVNECNPLVDSNTFPNLQK